MGAAKKRAYSMANRAASKEQTRERILQAAFQRFLREHYEDVTLKAIAEDAQVSLQTVLLHFESKEGLVRAGIQWRKPREEKSREVPPGDIEAAARVVVDRYEEIGRATVRWLAAEERYAAVAELVAVGRAAHRAWVETTFAETLRQSRGAARLRKTMALVAVCDVYVWHVLRRELDREQTVKTIAEMIRAIVEP